MQTRVLIVAEDLLARAGLVALLANQDAYTVVGQTADRDDLQSELEAYRPDVILWDLGWKATLSDEQLAEAGEAGAPVLALVPDSSDGSSILAAGVRGVLPRSVELPALLAAIKAVAEGLIVLTPELSPVFAPARARGSAALVEDLTPRETVVLHLLAEGLPNKTIARRLGISEHTVKFHLNSIMGKLGAQSRTEAVIMATRSGLLLL